MAPADRTWRPVAFAMLAAGWGANQFAPLLLAYRAERGLSEQLVTGMFAAYVGGLAPALLAAAWASHHLGKRPLVRASALLMLIGDGLLLLGADAAWLLFVGRLVSGVGVGFVMGPGTAWVTELSAGHPVGTGARRSTVALTSGFALGALVAGLVAQWLVAPLHLAYLLHVVVQVVATVLVWRVAEVDAADRPTPSVRTVVDHVLSPWFRHLVVPSAPWVFGTATVAFAVVPALVGRLPGVPAVAASGLAAGLTLGTSVLVQPSVRRFAGHDPGRTPPLGMAVTAVGMLLATGAALAPHPVWILPAALVLGCAQGLLMAGSITIVEHHTPDHLMAATTAVVYCLAYIGFLAPWVVSVLTLLVPAYAVLAFGAVVALATVAWLRHVRREA
ncbi:MAG: MFS transporter [Actinomycetes bacterium]